MRATAIRPRGWASRSRHQRFATQKIEFDTAAKERENALLQRENRAAEMALGQEQRANRS